GLALVMSDKMLYVLKQKRTRLFRRDNFRDLEKQRALSLVTEAMLASQRVLLCHARNTERLARKPGDQNFVIRDGANFDRVNITRRLVAEVCFVCDLRLLIPLTGKDTPSARR